MTPLLQGPKDLHLEVPQPLKEMILIHPSLPPISSRLRLHHMLKESLQQIPRSTSSPKACTIETQVSGHVIEEEHLLAQQKAIAEIKSILDSPQLAR